MKMVLELDIEEYQSIEDVVRALRECTESLNAAAPKDAVLKVLLDNRPGQQYAVLIEGIPERFSPTEVDGNVSSRLVVMREDFNKKKYTSKDTVVVKSISDARAIRSLLDKLEES